MTPIEHAAHVTTTARGYTGGPLPRFDVLLPAPVLTAQVHAYRRLVIELTEVVAQLTWQREEPGPCTCHQPPQEHDRWVLPMGALGPADAGHQITDEAIRTFGRRHIEHMLSGLPPLPARAWEADSHDH